MVSATGGQMGSTNLSQPYTVLPAIGSGTNSKNGRSDYTDASARGAAGGAKTSFKVQAAPEKTLNFTIQDDSSDSYNQNSLMWDANPPALPGKSPIYKKILKPFTPDDEGIDKLLASLRFRLSQMKKGTLEKLFLWIDVNRNGTIERDEIRKVLENFNEYPSPNKFEQFYNYMDTKRDGVIDFTEFCQALSPVVENDADHIIRDGAGDPDEDAVVAFNTQTPRRKKVDPKYDQHGAMYGSGMSFVPVGQVPRILPTTTPLLGSPKRKPLGRQRSRRVGSAHSSAKLLMVQTDTDDLAEIIQLHAVEQGYNQLSWTRWLGIADPSRPGTMSIDDLCCLLNEKLGLEIGPMQVYKMANDLGLLDESGEDVDMGSFLEQFGPTSNIGVIDENDRTGGISPNRRRSKSNRGDDCGEDEPVDPQMEALLHELAIQIQTGPSAVNHNTLVREFSQADARRTGKLSVADFNRVLTKVTYGTALRDLGMQDFEELAGGERINYRTFIKACMSTGHAYGTNKGASVTSMARYNPSKRIERQQQAALESFAPKGGEDLPMFAETGRTRAENKGFHHSTSNVRVAGPSWRDASLDQVYKDTYHITVPEETCPHYLDDAQKWQQPRVGVGVSKSVDGPRHRAVNAPEGKLLRIQEGRRKVEHTVRRQDELPLARHEGRLKLFGDMQKAYRGNLTLDDRAAARLLGDSHSNVRYQPIGDLTAHGKSLSRAASRKWIDTADVASDAAPPSAKPGRTQYARLPFVGS